MSFLLITLVGGGGELTSSSSVANAFGQPTVLIGVPVLTFNCKMVDGYLTFDKKLLDRASQYTAVRLFAPQ